MQHHFVRVNVQILIDVTAECRPTSRSFARCAFIPALSNASKFDTGSYHEIAQYEAANVSAFLVLHRSTADTIAHSASAGIV
jgi:hypothetical protein